MLRFGQTPARSVTWQTTPVNSSQCVTMFGSCCMRSNRNLRGVTGRFVTATTATIDLTDETQPTQTDDTVEAHGDETSLEASPVRRLGDGRSATVRHGTGSWMCGGTTVARRGLLSPVASASCADAVTRRQRHPRRLHHGLRRSPCGVARQSGAGVWSRVVEATMGLSLSELSDYLADRYPGLDWTDAEISRRVGLSRDTVKKYRSEGVPIFTADQIAISLGVHPCRIWERWWSC